MATFPPSRDALGRSYRRLAPKGYWFRGYSYISLACWVLCVSCAYPNPPANENQALTSKLDKDYRFEKWIDSRVNLGKKINDITNNKLIILSFSGGGVRAATVAAGVLDELERQNLGGMIALISSTSGGSVTAALYAAKGIFTKPVLAATSNRSSTFGNIKSISGSLPAAFLLSTSTYVSVT